MIRNVIGAICVSALGVGVANAVVLPQSNAFYISGSTALNNQLYADLLQTGGACAAGTISVYIDNTVAGTSGGLPKAHQAAIVCTLAKAIGTGLAVGSNVAFMKESNGGSNEGTNNVANLIALPFLNAGVAGACSAGVSINAGQYYTHQQAFTEFDNCTNLANQVPSIGLADENPELFNVGPDAIATSAIAKLTVRPMFQNDFGIAVSLNLYRKLQTAQGKGATDTLADVPSLSHAQIAGLYTGAIDWSGVLGVPAPSSVFLCRRGDTSGTNVSADVYFLRNRCTTTHTAMPLASTLAANCSGLPGGESPTNFGCKWTSANVADAVFAGTGSGDVVSCLHAHDQANNFAFGALGVTSKFDDPNGTGGSGDTTGSSHFRYVAIDGSKPTVVSHANGTYTYFMDNVVNTLKTLSGNPAAVATFIQTSLTSAIPLSDTFAVQPGGDANYVTGGLLDAQNPNGLAPSGATVTLADVTANPVSPFTMSPAGPVDNCQAPLPIAVTQSVQQ
jgi:hypothetical protein